MVSAVWIIFNGRQTATHAFGEPHLDAEHADVGGAGRGGGGGGRHGWFVSGGRGRCDSSDFELDFYIAEQDEYNKKSKTQMDCRVVRLTSFDSHDHPQNSYNCQGPLDPELDRRTPHASHARAARRRRRTYSQMISQ